MEAEKKQKIFWVIGPYQGGKDTFIYNIRRSFGEELRPTNSFSPTKQNELVRIKNNEEEEFYLNTVGFANLENVTDESLALDILEWYLNIGTTLLTEQKLDGIFLIQALNDPFKIERCLIYLKIIFGEEIVDSCMIIAMKGNRVDEEDLDEKKEDLQNFVEKYKIKAGYHDFRGLYLLDTKKEGLKEKGCGLENVKKQIELIRAKANEMKPSFFTKLMMEFDHVFAEELEKQENAVKPPPPSNSQQMVTKCKDFFSNILEPKEEKRSEKTISKEDLRKKQDPKEEKGSQKNISEDLRKEAIKKFILSKRKYITNEKKF